MKKFWQKYDIWIILAVVFLVSTAGGWWLRRVDDSLPDGGKAPEIELLPADPLADVPEKLRPLTIPYLRDRDYISTLQIGDVLERTANYTAYLAWYDSDGARVYGLLSVPRGEAPAGGWPAVILLHGYVHPSSYQTNGASYRGWWQTLAATGEWVIFKPDFRGHGQSEGQATGPYFGADYVVDTLNARAALVNWEQVNGQRIALWGHSMSGNTALRALAARPEIPAVALWAGAIYTYDDFVRYGITDPSYRPDRDREPARQAELASEAAELFDQDEQINLETPFWRAMRPTNFLNDGENTGAIGLFHAEDDAVVNVGYSEDFNAWLDETDLRHELHLYGSGGHNLSGGTFAAAMADLREFLRKNL